MGLTASTLSRSLSSSPRRRRSSKSSSDPMPLQTAAAVINPARDHTLDLPDECLALIFHSLGSGDRKRCSLVCRRWLAVEGQSRHRLALDARAALLDPAPALFARFDAVTKLALKCDRRSESIGDDALAIIAARCPKLSRLKLRACRQLTDRGMAALAASCPALRKLSCASCTFGPAGIAAVLLSCPLLEDLSIKRLRGLTDAADPVGPPSSALRSICLKELYNAQCFAPLIAGSPNLRSLKILRCSGDWDLLLEEIAGRVPGIFEVHLEKIQVSDRGLFALSSCPDLEVLHIVKVPECTDAGVTAIADKCRLLRKIHIDGWRTNRIGDLGLIAIARGCPNLQELVLIGVNPTVLSLEPIASICRGLERLALCGCETIGDAEISCIAAKCAALKKLCIKGCPVSDRGMEALADGCPSLVKVKLKRCRGVTPEGVEWLRAARGESFAVNLDSVEKQEQDLSMSESRVQENGVEQNPVLADHIAAIDLPSSSNSNGRSASSKARLRNFVASFRRLSVGSSNSHH
ncbi:F-box protein At1g47056-like [Phoenix dactylifera]|uniref:F-box protein At1g47056-like n=1 Tax=Phoenix dactylifera TaxID=42345 RepID=A0A8B7CCU6_PHODC|nr:F-box protein At1g47056-like [Phoenix dactylifera]